MGEDFAVEMDNKSPPDICHCSSRVDSALCFLFVRAQVHAVLLAARRVDAQELLAEVNSMPLLLSTFAQVVPDLIRVDNGIYCRPETTQRYKKDCTKRSSQSRI